MTSRRAETPKVPTITKADLVQAVHDKVGFSKKESSEVVERVFETMKHTLEAGDELKISGFGKFDVRRKNARRGRNPKTKNSLIIPERTVVTFKASQVLKALVGGENAIVVASASADVEDSEVDELEDDELEDGEEDGEEDGDAPTEG